VRASDLPLTFSVRFCRARGCDQGEALGGDTKTITFTGGARSRGGERGRRGGHGAGGGEQRAGKGGEGQWGARGSGGAGGRGRELTRAGEGGGDGGLGLGRDLLANLGSQRHGSHVVCLLRRDVQKPGGAGRRLAYVRVRVPVGRKSEAESLQGCRGERCELQGLVRR